MSRSVRVAMVLLVVSFSVVGGRVVRVGRKQRGWKGASKPHLNGGDVI